MTVRTYISLILILAFRALNAQEKISYSSACTLSISSSPASSSTTCNGSITINTGTVCPPISYTVTPGNNFINLCTGTYTVNFQDAGCCGFLTGTVFVGAITEIAENRSDNNPKISFDNRVLYFNNIKKAYCLNLINLTGQIVKSIIIESSTESLLLCDLPHGVYFVELLENKELLKFIKIYYD